MTRHLWEHEHPYHCNLDNYFSNDCAAKFDSWADFYAENKDNDDDYNLLFRFDWYPKEHYADDDEPAASDTLELFYVGQRKGLFRSVTVSVKQSDEDAVRAWLVGRWRHLRALWEPLAADAGEGTGR